MAATNMDDLRQMIMKEMESAMNELKDKSESIMKEETGGYHTVKPKIYPPTGNLANSPKTTNVSRSGDSLQFKAYLDQSLSYSGVNAYLQQLGYVSRFTTNEAYNAAEKGTSHTIGNHGFWQRSEQRIEQEVSSVFGSHFK